MKYIITKSEPFKPYFGMGSGDPAMYCRELYTLFDVACIEISEVLFDTLYPILPVGIEEVPKEEALFGSVFFGEIRDKVKIVNPTSLMADTNAMPETEKIQIDMTEEFRGYIVDFMYRFAKELIDDEFNYRFKVMKKASDLESQSWEIQKSEAKEWLEFQGADGHRTPLLDYLAEEHGTDKTELANKILSKAEQWVDTFSEMLVTNQKLVKEFKNAGTVKQMNILYEKYFGIMMPISQAQELGLADEWGDRIFINDNGEKMYEVVNPYMGHKFNF
jgi:hypothetical protein